MTAVDGLVTWLGAALDEDERLAQAAIDATGAPGHSRVGQPYADGSGTLEVDAFPSYPWGLHEDESAFTADPGHPERVLAEVEAKRALIDLAVGCPTCGTRAQIPHGCPGIRSDGALDMDDPADPWRHALLVMAQPLAGRPGFRDEWRLGDA